MDLLALRVRLPLFALGWSISYRRRTSDRTRWIERNDQRAMSEHVGLSLPFLDPSGQSTDDIGFCFARPGARREASPWRELRPEPSAGWVHVSSRHVDEHDPDHHLWLFSAETTSTTATATASLLLIALHPAPVVLAPAEVGDSR